MINEKAEQGGKLKLMKVLDTELDEVNGRDPASTNC